MKLPLIRIVCSIGICMGLSLVPFLFFGNAESVVGTYTLDETPNFSYGGATTGPIDFGGTVAGSIDYPRQIDVYEFSADVGDTIIIRVSSNPGDLWAGVRLRDPDNSIIAEARSFDTAEVCPTLSTSGVHKIELFDGFDGTNTGSYCLYLERLNNPGNALSMDFGQVLDGTITEAAQMEAFTFLATAGDYGIIRMTYISGAMWAGIRLYDPEGYLISESRSFNTAEILSNLPKTGSYVALAYDGWNGTCTGSFQMGLYMNTPGDANGDKSIDGHDLIATKMTMLDIAEPLSVLPGVDANQDGSVDGLDLIEIRKIILMT